MTEDKITKLNEIKEMLPEISKAKGNSYTSYINALACLEVDKLDLSLIDNLSEFIYKNVSDACKFLFLYTTLD